MSSSEMCSLVSEEVVAFVSGGNPAREGQSPGPRGSRAKGSPKAPGSLRWRRRRRSRPSTSPGGSSGHVAAERVVGREES